MANQLPLAQALLNQFEDRYHYNHNAVWECQSEMTKIIFHNRSSYALNNGRERKDNWILSRTVDTLKATCERLTSVLPKQTITEIIELITVSNIDRVWRALQKINHEWNEDRGVGWTKYFWKENVGSGMRYLTVREVETVVLSVLGSLDQTIQWKDTGKNWFEEGTEDIELLMRSMKLLPRIQRPKLVLRCGPGLKIWKCCECTRQHMWSDGTCVAICGHTRCEGGCMNKFGIRGPERVKESDGYKLVEG